MLASLASLIIGSLTPGLAAAQPAGPDESPGSAGSKLTGIPGEIPASTDPDLAAWQELGYGMFIHWGIYSELGGVWQGEPVTEGYSEQIQMWANIPEPDYAEVASRFTASEFDPAAICSLAKDAGMKYVVITSKHHDGFSMFDTATTTYDVVDATAYGQDPLKLLSEECRRQGLGFGVYFSLVDWHQGHEFDGGNENPIPAEMEPVIEGQLTELMTSYGPISEVWFDMSAPTVAQSEKFADIVRTLQPDAAINSRIWNNEGDFRTLGDNETPTVAIDGPWQTPASIYHETWGYRSWQVREDLPGKITQLLGGLVGAKAGGGNYLLNIGPQGDGSVVEFEADVLRGMGAWLDRHPGVVDGASGTRFGPQPWGVATVNDRELYLTVTELPDDRQIRLPGLATDPRAVVEDGTEQPLSWTRDGNDLIVTLPETPADEVLPVVRVDLKGELRIVPPSTELADAAGTWSVPATSIETGYSYADEGRYGSTARTEVRQTAYLAAKRGDKISLAFSGTADPELQYKVAVGSRSELVSGADLVSQAIGPFKIKSGQVTPVTITLAEPAHPGQDLGLALDHLLAAPDGKVVATALSEGPVTIGASTDLAISVTNFGQKTVSGTVEVTGPDGWTVAPLQWAVDSLGAGTSVRTEVAIEVPESTEPGSYTLTTGLAAGRNSVGRVTDVTAQLPNLAEGRAAEQSSTAWDGVAQRAVDGNTDGQYFNGSVTHTAETLSEQWWQVDLGAPVAVSQVDVWNREDCCADRLSDYYVFVSPEPIEGGTIAEVLAQPGVWSAHLTQLAGRPTIVPTSVTGQYVRIQRTGTGPLSLAEIQVRGRLP